MKRVIFILISALLLLAVPIHAEDLPNFSTCPNPGGDVLASYDTGTHAIAGDPVIHFGSDYVYELSNTTVTQCYCPVSGTDGIQTNWWDVASLSQDQINTLKGEGWIYISNGSSWGLNSDPYLALNTGFTCGSVLGTTAPTPTPDPTSTPTPSADPTATPQPSSTPDPDLCKNIDGVQTSVPDGLHLAGDNCIAFQLGGAPTPPPTDPGTPQGQVLGASTSVLADTSSDQTLPRIIASVISTLGVFFLLI